MSEWESPKVDLGHPDSAIRLASAVHRFRVPKMNKERKVSFAKSFYTSGKHEKTRKVMLKADDARQKLMDAVLAGKVSHERVVVDAKRYQPFIHQILLSCKVQPEVARLDDRLVFEWMSGIEQDQKFYKSEAIMYDLVMCVICEGLGKAGAATEASVAGEFGVANREYAAAAGIFQFLAEDHLPKWTARGSHTDDTQLPIECNAATADGLRILFQANGQQMAVATVLIKPGTPNYSLVAKLCLGTVEMLEEFVKHMRDNAFRMMARMDKDFFTLVTFQITLQKALSLYFYGRALWEKAEYGLAIAFLSEAGVALQTRVSIASVGVPDVSKIPSLKALTADLTDLRAHMALVLKVWEKDNSHVFFEKVPQSVPQDKKLEKGVRIGKVEKFKISSVDPVLLALPENLSEQSDSDFAKELQDRLNSGLEEF